MKNYSKLGFQIPQVLLPKAGTDLTRWAVIACDQFTSQPEYWNDVERTVGDAPSTLRLILPEVYLEKPGEGERIQTTQQAMKTYVDKGLFETYEGLILVERQAAGKTRRGVMLALDLECYDFNKGSQSLIRATEGTILERLPPRIKIRSGAPLELPHILVLIDDPQDTVIGALAARKAAMKKIYDFDLMLGSGHLTGYFSSDPADEQALVAALEKLADPAAFPALKARMEADPRLTVELKREPAYYLAQSEMMATFLRILGLSLTAIFSLGAIIGALITMHSAVANRVGEIGTLRALGFQRRHILLAFLLESLCLGLLGWVLGAAAASCLQLVTVSTMNFQTFAELAFSFALTPAILLQSLAFALGMGLAGGFLPELKAVRLKVVDALRTA